MDVSVFSPAKLNLFLAVTGRRADGFHDLVSLVTPLTWGDDLEAQLASLADGARFSLACDHPEVPLDGTNLILRAAEAFAVAANWRGAVHFKLTKRIPVGAGLGGGSSNAAAALRALNRLAGDRLDEAQLAGVAATLGSDCVLFLRQAPVVMRGRGERIEPLPEPVLARLRGRRVLLFKPSFGISTPWAYQRLIARGGDYLAAEEAERRLAGWVGGEAPAEELLFNNMEPAAFEKYGALSLLLGRLRRDFGAAVAMSGSGSACFALLKEEDGDAVVAGLKQVIRAGWGDVTFVQDARLA
jgi:4-diphosphocytidyl-2-C-methyl-D-erythritol kinase